MTGLTWLISPWVPGKMQATYSGNSAGGTLTVTDGSQSVSLELSGNYTNATWVLSKDKTGGTIVVDPPSNTSPPASILDSLLAGDLATHSSLGLNNALTTPGVQDHAPPNLPPSLDHVVALFNQFTAAGFPEQHGGSITTNALSQIMANEQSFLANPHHG